ncbi:uncharacterized protein BCN122_II3221 [Burkholderia cenocepacia]|nr:uncharacterized protein BCN122_II3221 [Burkholderia cenocepacia]
MRSDGRRRTAAMSGHGHSFWVWVSMRRVADRNLYVVVLHCAV